MNTRSLAGWSRDFNFPAEIRCLCHSLFCCLFSSPTTLCLPWYSQFRKDLIFSYSDKETKRFLHLTFSHSGKIIFPVLCAFLLPFSSCRYFWLLLPRQPNLFSTYPVILLLWPHKYRVFLVFPYLQGEWGKDEGREKERRGRKFSLSLPMGYHGGQAYKLLHTEDCCPSSPSTTALLCPSRNSPFLRSASRSLCGWKHSRQPIIVFSRVQIASPAICIFT